MLHRKQHGFDCSTVAEVYDQDGEGSANEIAARTGCAGCPLASQDFSLQRIIRKPQWEYLTPLLRLKPLWEQLREHHNRVRKDNSERKADGSPVANPGRIGPLTLDARRAGLQAILDIQGQVNATAQQLGRPPMDMLNTDEVSRIQELIDANTWPNRWTGEELPGDTYVPQMSPDGFMQNQLFGE